MNKTAVQLPKCDLCGKKLTVITKYGMFCEDRHHESEAIQAGKQLEELIKLFCPEDD